MTVDRVEPASHFEAERRGKRLLHPSAGDDERGAILVDQFAENDGEEIEFRRNQSERLAQLKHAAGVDGVLTSRAPMHVAGGVFFFFGDEQGELFHQGNCEIAGAGCGAGQDGHVVKFGAAFRFNGRSRGGRNETCARLGSCQGGLEIEHGLQRGPIGEDLFDGLRAKQGVKQVHGQSLITPAMETKLYRNKTLVCVGSRWLAPS